MGENLQIYSDNLYGIALLEKKVKIICSRYRKNLALSMCIHRFHILISKISYCNKLLQQSII